MLLSSILGWARTDDRVDVVVQTGSRARNRRVDALSDLDIELIGPQPDDLAGDGSWIAALGDVMVTLALANDGPGQSGWPSRLVVFGQGRKVDFTLAGPRRLEEMVAAGLDELYDAGYLVHLDKSGATADLPHATLEPPRRTPPTQAEFSAIETEFWFEATQVAIYLARGDLWVVKLREHTMHQDLLRMLEWLVQTDPVHPAYTWHIGHHLAEWLPTREYEMAQAVFARYDPEDTRRALDSSMSLFADVSARVAERLGLAVRTDLPDRVRAHSDAVRHTRTLP